MNEKRYTVKDEFIDKWFCGCSSEAIDMIQANGITRHNIEQLSKYWDVPVKELLKQVVEIG